MYINNAYCKYSHGHFCAADSPNPSRCRLWSLKVCTSFRMKGWSSAQHIPWSLTVSPLKNDGWKKLLDPFGDAILCSGALTVKVPRWGPIQMFSWCDEDPWWTSSLEKANYIMKKGLHPWKLMWNLNFWSTSEKEKHLSTNHQLSGSMLKFGGAFLPACAAPSAVKSK